MQALAKLRDAAERADWDAVQVSYIELQLEPASQKLDANGFKALTEAMRLRDVERVVAALDWLEGPGSTFRQDRPQAPL